MPSKSDHPAPRRSSYFWWTLINFLALAFAVLSWTGCYFLFNFPERPWNYSVLKKFDRLPELSFIENEDLPKVTTLPPDKLYGMIYKRQPTVAGLDSLPEFLNPQTLQTLNIQLKRNYLTNFKDAKNLNYVRGTWRILSVRALTKEDFIQQGFVVLAQALAIPAEQENSTNPELFPFPVELEIVLPTAKGVAIPADTEIKTSNSFELSRLPHALGIIHIARGGTNDEPVSRITAIPLLDSPFQLTSESRIPVQAPKHVNPNASLPFFGPTEE